MRHQKGKPVPKLMDLIGKVSRKLLIISLKTMKTGFCLQHLPSFGPFIEERQAIVRQHKEKVPPLDQFKPEVHRPAFQPKKPVPTVQVSYNVNAGR